MRPGLLSLKLTHQIGRMPVVAPVRSYLAGVPPGITSPGLRDGQGSLILVKVDPLTGSSVNDLALVVPVDLKK